MMLLRYETTLIVYQHKDKTILCRVNVVPAKHRDPHNTCRALTTDQWSSFDKELRSWLDIRDTNESSDSEEDKLCQFIVKPNLEVKIRKSKLSSKVFYKCVKNPDSAEELTTSDALPVLDCKLEYKENVPTKLPLTPSIPSDEYEPIATTNALDNTTGSLSYEPYTPSKKKPSSKYSIADTIKTPGLDFLGFESADDGYSPLVDGNVALSEATVPIYKAAPIGDSPDSIANEVIQETDDENESGRYRLKREKQRINAALGEYIPDIVEDAPAYNPTPIEDTAKQQKPKVPKEFINKEEEANEDRKKLPKNKKRDKSFKEIKSSSSRRKEDKEIQSSSENEDFIHRSKDKEKKTDGQKSKENKSHKGSKEDVILKSRTRSTKKSSPLSSSEDEFEKLSAPSKEKDTKKEKRRSKEEILEKSSKTESTGRDTKESKVVNAKSETKDLPGLPSSSSEEDYEKWFTKPKEKDRKKEKRRSKEEVVENNKKSESSKKDAKSTTSIDGEDKSNRHKDKKKEEKRKSKETTADTGQTEAKKDDEKVPLTESTTRKDKTSTSSSNSIRRSERSPAKPRRFIEEQEKYLHQKKPRNKELFGTDDDDEPDNKPKASDSNNNSSNKLSTTAFQTPKSNNKPKSILLSSSSSSSAKKKRKRNDCEQEKADINKWLGKKDSKPQGETGVSSSKSFEDKSSKKLKSSKDGKETARSKSDSPQPMDIVMLSEKEMEIIRTKAKKQREDNEKLKAALEKVNIAPKEVEQLSLKDMTLKDLMDTFEVYKPDLDKIYEKYCKKDHVKSHEGANHCLVIGLIDRNIQFKMLEQLSEVYNSTNSTTQATLYANALLPEWVLRIFMERYNLKRTEAIQHIEDQDAYMSYTEAQNENSFLGEL
uniref:Uncharacterized protein n=1 Tax=Stomoxys calcitrans TaxID=35570 RepID=A0A1I8QC82_STOCA